MKSSNGEFVRIEEDEIEAVQIESSHTMNLDGFVEKASIQQIYLDTPYYVAPADKVSEEAFAVIRDAHGRQEDGGAGAHRALSARTAGRHRAAAARACC